MHPREVRRICAQRNIKISECGGVFRLTGAAIDVVTTDLWTVNENDLRPAVDVRVKQTIDRLPREQDGTATVVTQ